MWDRGNGSKLSERTGIFFDGFHHVDIQIGLLLLLESTNALVFNIQDNKAIGVPKLTRRTITVSDAGTTKLHRGLKKRLTPVPVALRKAVRGIVGRFAVSGPLQPKRFTGKITLSQPLRPLAWLQAAFPVFRQPGRIVGKFFVGHHSRVVNGRKAPPKQFTPILIDMQIAAGPDAVAQESTRVLGVAANATQATYDLEKWSSVVFVGYGLDLMSAVAALEMEQRLASFYGLPSTDDLEGQLASPAIVEYRAEVDMLGSMSADDPPFFVHNTLPATLPTDQGVLFHHPYHARALRDRAAEVGVDCTATIEALDIEDSPGESDWEFLLEALGV